MKTLISISEERTTNFFKRNKFEKTEFQIFGIDGRTLSAREYFEMGVKGRRCALTPSEVGCTLSHLATYEAFLSSSEEVLLVMEDDVTVIRIPEELQSVVLNFRAEPVLLHLGGQNGLKSRGKLLGKLSTTCDNLWEVEKKGTRWLWRTCGYLINREMAKLIIKKQRTILRTADSWMYFFEQEDVKVLYAECIEHPLDLSTSQIESERLGKAVIESLAFRTFLFRLHALFTLIELWCRGNKVIPFFISNIKFS
jgi:glycosyl transferase family 25